MHRFSIVPPLLIIVLVCGSLCGQERAPNPGAGAERRGAELASRILRYQETSGFRARARLSVSPAGSEGPTIVAMVRILGSRDGGARRILYQALWPLPARGYALYVERPDAGAESSGFLFQPPDLVVPLNQAVRLRTFLESDVSMEDLIEDFWRWPSQRVTGQAVVGDQPCTVLESRPARGQMPAYGLVRSCIADRPPVPMRVEKFDRDDRLLKRMTFIAPTRGGPDGPMPARILVEVPGATRTTTIEYFGSERDIVIPAEEFSIERLKRAAAGGK